MKKLLLWCAGILVAGTLIISGIQYHANIQKHSKDPNRKLAEQIYNMEKALQEVDADYACKSISTVTPYTYNDSDGNTITYYCCQTTYLADTYREDITLNTDAIGLVIDFSQIENRRSCIVNAYAAFLCEIGPLSYLCWTISPEISCVIAYNADVTAEADIFRMAQSVQ